MPHEVIKFRCDHCQREYASRRNAELHELKCFYVDANRACVTCAHFKAHAEHGDLAKAECDIELDLIDIPFGDYGLEHHYQSNCNGWEKRTAEGTYKFGKTFIEET
jgi:hypothetical protein